MSCTGFDINRLQPGELMLLIPNEVLGGGEPGEPLNDEVCALINGLAQVGYWPVDFGEARQNSVELWFEKSSRAIARKQAQHFIAKGGDV